MIALVAAVAAVAALDAIRGRDWGSPPSAAPRDAATRSQAVPPAALARRLRSEGIDGVLVLVTPDCRVRSLVLPELRASVPAPSEDRQRTCARTAGGLVSTPADHARTPGGGGLRLEPEDCPAGTARCHALFLSAADLRRTGVPEPRVLDHARLSPTRAGVLLAWPGGGYVLALFEGTRLLASHRWGGVGHGQLRASPGGALVAARPARVFRRDGTPVTLAPRFRNARAVAWSPDGGWTALAMTGAVVLVPTHALVGGAEARRAIRLPVPARDLEWRPR